MGEPAPSTGPAPAAPAPRPRRGLIGRACRRPLAMSFGLVAALLPWVVAGWLLGTESGLRTLADAANTFSRGAVRLTGVQGTLLDRVSVEGFELRLPHVDIRAAGVCLAWQPAQSLDGTLRITRLEADSLRVRLAASDAPARVPEAFALPLDLDVDALRVGRFDLESVRPPAAPERLFGLSAVRGGARLRSTQWVFEDLQARTDWGPARLAGTLAPQPPFAVSAQGALSLHQAGRDVAVRVEARGSLVALALSVQARADALAADGTLEVRSFAEQPIGPMNLRAGQIDPRRFDPRAPEAALALQVWLAPSLEAAGAPDAARRADLRVEGRFELTNARPGAWDAQRLPLTRASGRVRLGTGRIDLRDLAIELPGQGRAGGELSWERPQTPDDPVGALDAAIDVAGLDPRALHGALPAARLRGRLTAQAGARTQTLTARLSDPRLQLDADVQRRGARVEVRQARLTAGEARLEGKGTITLDAARRVDASVRVSRLDPAQLWASAPRGRVGGALAVTGQLSPRRLDARLELADSVLGDAPLSGEAEVRLEAERLAHVRVDLSAMKNRIEADGAFGGRDDRLEFRVVAPALDALGLGVGGRVRASGRLWGPARSPAGVLNLAASRIELPDGHRLDALNVQGALAEGREGRLDLRVTLAGLRQPGGGEALVRRAAWVVEGTRRAHRMAVQLDALGGRELDLAAEGGLTDGLAWQGMLTGLRFELLTELALSAPATLAMGADHLDLGPVRLDGPRAHVESDILSWRAGRLQARGRLSGLQLALRMNDAGRMLARSDTLAFGGNWDLDFGDRVNGQVRLFREAGDLVLEGDAPVPLGLTELEAVLAASDDRLAASVSAAGAQIGVISAAATALSRRDGEGWRLDETAPLLGSARIEVPSIRWVGPLLEPGMRTEGAVTGEFSLAGSPARPEASGRLRGEGLGLALADLGVRLAGGRLQASFDADRFRLDELVFESRSAVRPRDPRVPFEALTATPGRGTARGEIDLATGNGRFDFVADRLQVLERPDRWLVVSGEAQAVTGWTSLDLTARLKVPAGLFSFGRQGAPTLGDDVLVRGRTREREAATSRRTRADVRLDLGQQLYLRALGVDTRLEGEIALQMQPGETLRASGTVSARDGLYDAYGQRLTIAEGEVTFIGPVDNPTLAVTALRTGLPVEAGVRISGSAQRPRIRLVSTPNVPDAEKLSWIVLGRGPADGSEEGDSAMLMAAAGALMGDAANSVTGQIARTFGIDQIALAQAESRGLGAAATSQVAGSATGFAPNSALVIPGAAAGQVVTIGKRLTNALSVSLEQGIGSASSIVRLSYALSRRLSAVARAGTENAIDLHYSVSFR